MKIEPSVSVPGTPRPETAARRHSGIELLRIVSMLCVLLCHANFYALGSPREEELLTATGFGRIFFEFLTIIGVNVFVLISGWFGIRQNGKRLLGLWFQCAFFCIVLYAVGIMLGVPLNWKWAARDVFWVGGWNWFIKSYVALFLLAPILNTFVESATKEAFRNLLVLFFVFQTAFWLFPMTNFDFINDGYSVFSFVGLYLLARFIRLHKPRYFVRSRRFDAAVFASIVLLSSLIYLGQRIAHVQLFGMLAYSSPLVILSSVWFFLFFSKLSFRSEFVNGIARSAYSVYLLQTHPSVSTPLFYPLVAISSGHALAGHWLKSKFQHWVIRPDFPSPEVGLLGHFGLLLLTIGSFFVAAVLLDRIRIAGWSLILRMASGKKTGDGA